MARLPEQNRGMETDNIRMRDWFQRFAEQAGGSPMYQMLSRRISEDADLLRLASKADTSQPVPNLFLAAVHFQLMQNRSAELVNYYPSLGGAAPSEAAGEILISEFKSFCREHESALIFIMQKRLVQTNEIQRTCVLLPALRRIQAEIGAGEKLALIDVGASGGLNLLLDRVFIKYSDGVVLGPGDSRLKLSCKLTGKIGDSGPQPLIARRIAIDLNPIDFANADELSWAEALIWPDQPERIARLREGVGLLESSRIDFRIGDALEVLPNLIRQIEADVTICVMHSFVLNQFTEDGREKFETALAAASQNRDIWRIGLEWIRTKHPELSLYLYSAGQRKSVRSLAECDGHASWIDWKSV